MSAPSGTRMKSHWYWNPLRWYWRDYHAIDTGFAMRWRGPWVRMWFNVWEEGDDLRWKAKHRTAFDQSQEWDFPKGWPRPANRKDRP